MSLTAVTTRSGALSGLDMGSYAVFKGVPYAAPPVGPLRWKRPQPCQPWEGVRPATEFAPGCPQTPHDPDSFYYKEFYRGDHSPKSEDCLYLNVYTPAKAPGEKLPVLFWVHGGAFTHGWSNEIEFDGAPFCAQGVILVSINYRVGLFGFLAHPLLSAENEEGISGNYGLYDQAAALRWVHDNIAAFGGDPDNVTIFGQSAGAMSIQILCGSPLCKGLFQGAILQSGAGLNRSVPMQETAAQNAAYLGSQGFDTLEKLRALPADALVELMQQAGGGRPLACGPVLDGLMIPDTFENILSQGLLADVHYMIGSTVDELGEGFAEAVFRGAATWAENQLAQNREPAWVYYFDRIMPGDDAGAFHSAELWYIFGTYEKCWRPLTGQDAALSRQISAYWANFAKTGDPNGPGLPRWTPYTAQSPQRLRLGFDIRMDNVTR